MSNIQMIIDLCNCCDIPVDHCEVVLGLIKRGVDPALVTHEVLCPEVSQDDNRMAV